MITDDAIYAFILLLSLTIGPLIQRSGFLKPWISGFLGFFVFFCFTGPAVWHSMVTVMGFVFMLNIISGRFIHYMTVIWCFGYLAFFRTCHFFGYTQVSPITNVVQLLLTLRLVGLSFELADSHKVKKKLDQPDLPNEEREQLTLWKKYKDVDPSPLDTIAYAYCYVGLFTGPYYTFRTFSDFINSHCKSHIYTDETLGQHIQEALPFGVAYIILSHFYTVDYVRLPEFYNRYWMYRLMYMVIVFITFRMRIYFAWKMAECVCMSVSLGLYPVVSEPQRGQGPTNLRALDCCVKQEQHCGSIYLANPDCNNLTKSVKTELKNSINLNSSKTDANCHFPNAKSSNILYNYTTIQNISIWGCEFAPTIRESMKSWNCSVQYWLANYFYKRCFGSKNFRTVVTMLISAYWHGIHPGYFLAFTIIPLAMCAESSLAQLINLCGLDLPVGSTSFFTWLLRMRVLEYCSMSFLLLDYSTTMAYWSSIGYCIHILLVSIVVLHKFVELFIPRRLFSTYHRP